MLGVNKWSLQTALSVCSSVRPNDRMSACLHVEQLVPDKREPYQVKKKKLHKSNTDYKWKAVSFELNVKSLSFKDSPEPPAGIH